MKINKFHTSTFVLLQQQQQQNSPLHKHLRTISSNNNNIGTIALLRRIYVQEGLSGIYAGLRPTLVMAIPNTVLYFSAYTMMDLYTD
jgi:hypothetical protein